MSDAKPTLETSDHLAGRQLGDYLVLRMLGQGAMAEVYLAEQTSLRRQVALKVLKRELALDATYVQRFHREAQAAASLVHPGIVQIHEVNCVDSIHYIAQEYVPGQNLRDYMARRGPPDLKLALRVLRQTAAALGKAADAGIVHRDIKPENIMLAADGHVKVADFGLARQASEMNALNLTQIGVTMGTPLYMSPEQVQGRPLDPRSDIYSLGVTCYHMLAGHPPFRGDTALNVAVQHLNQQPTRLEELRPELPPGLCRAVHRMLAKEPDQRYSHARDLLKDLRALPIPDDEEAHPDDLDAWPIAEDDTRPTRVQATQQLAAVMQTQALKTARRRLPAAWLLAPVVALMLGGLLAAATRPAFLLSGADPSGTSVQRQDTAQAQYNYARWIDPSEDAWRAVELYFSGSSYSEMARKELAWLYLTRKDRQQAMEIFTHFANMDELDRSNRAFGLGGQAIVLHLAGEEAKAAAKLGELFKLGAGEKPDAIIELFRSQDQTDADRQMLDMLRRVIQKNHSVNAAYRAEWQNTLAEEFADETEPNEGS